MDQKEKKIILLHGALGVLQDFDLLSSHLEEMGYTILRFNFSGHGHNAAATDQFRIDLFAHDLEKFISAHKLESIPIFGYSMGGYVALYHKINFENSAVSNIITYGTKFNWSESSVGKELPMLDPDHVTEKYPLLVQSLKHKHGERWKILLRSTAHLMQNLQKLDGLTKEDLTVLDVPVTLIFGDQDRMVTTEETNLTGSWIPHCQVKTLAHSKHELERTNQKELALLIDQALSLD